MWEKDFPLLRFDLKFPKEPSQHALFNDIVTISFDSSILRMASIESTIAYKEEIARSEKGLLDARYLREVFSGLNEAKIEKYKRLFSHEFHR